MKPSDFDVDGDFISIEEVDEYLIGLTGRERRNYRRIQAWINHCKRIRSHPSSMIPKLGMAGHGIPQLGGISPRIPHPGETALPEMVLGSATTDGITSAGSFPGRTASGVVARPGSKVI